MLFQKHRVKRKIEKILKNSSSVSLIFKCPVEYPMEMKMQEVVTFMENNSNSFIVGLNENKKTGEPYFKVLSECPVDFSKWIYRVSGSGIGHKLKAEDYMKYFQNKRYIVIH